MKTTLTSNDNPVMRPGDPDRRRNPAVIVTMNIFNICLGHRVGLYQALAGGCPLTAAELASQTGVHEAVIRNWFRQQASAGILKLENPEAEPPAHRFRLPPAHVRVLVEWDKQAYRPLLAELAV